MRELIRMFALLTLLVLAFPSSILAQSYPNKPIRLVVGFAPGGTTDICARMIAPKLSEELGQPVIVENRPGAGTNVAQEIVINAAPDGYTLLLSTPSVVINKFLYKNLSFDGVRDLAGISLFSISPIMLVVNSSLPIHNLKEFITLARSKPGKITFSSAGNGTTQHLAGELFNIRANVKMMHVPYKGTSPSLIALISGEVDSSYSSFPVVMPHIKSGRVRQLATTGPKRSELMPDLPTMKESGVNMEMFVWFGVSVPKNTPRTIIDKLSQSLVKITHSPEIKQKLSSLGAEPVGSTVEEFYKQLHDEEAMWSEVVRTSKAVAD